MPNGNLTRQELARRELARRELERKRGEELPGGPPLISKKPIFGRTRVSRKPALGFLQRAKISFGDIPGRKGYLERLGFNIIQRTPEGNFIVEKPETGELRLTDPRGADIGDIADIAGGLFPLTGWIVGAVKGAAITAPTIAGIPTGAVAGGAAGAAVGEAARGILGRRMGVYAGGSPQIAGRAALRGAEAAAWEIGMPLAKRFITRPIGRFIQQRIWKKALQPFLENIFGFTADIPKKATAYAIIKNPRKIITRKYRAEEFPAMLAERVKQGSKLALDAVQKKWEDIVEPIKAKITNIIDYDDVLSKSRRIFQNFGLLDSRGYETKPFFKESARWNTVRDIWWAMGRWTKKTMPVKKAMQIRKEIDALINKGFKDNIFTPEDVGLLQGIRQAFNNQIHTKFPQIAAVDKAYHDLYNAFKIIDIDWKNPKAVSTLEGILAKYPELRITIQTALRNIDRQMPAKHKFIEDAMKHWTAMQFDPTKFRAIRTGILATILGAAGGLLGLPVGAGPGGALAGATIGGIISTPRGVGGILRLGAGARELIRQTARAIPTIARGAVTLRREQALQRKAIPPTAE